jgi:selenocysteine-specific elongation factor
MPESDAFKEEQRGPRHLILGTAGHIDHGKTALVRALTGTDTDRLPEERRRGMTIDLGFAHLDLGPVHFGIVDVPGHERFVRTMVAGATGIDMALIVIAGDDSVMPQTIEHVEVLRLVGIEHAVAVITKLDLVDETLVELVKEDVQQLLDRARLRNVPIVPVSSTDGTGLDELRDRIIEVADRVPDRDAAGPFRLAIDRVFTIKGRGTVVTGSVIQGTVHAGDALELHPDELSCRVRGLQSHGSDSEELELGQRAALNLIGVDRERIERGHELAAPGYLSPSRRVDARFEVLSTAKREIKPFSKLRVCLGTREQMARIVPLGREPIAPGASTFVQMRSGRPFFATHGQHFIARTENGTRTLGGGVVLRPHATRWSRDRHAERAGLETLESGDPTERLRQVLAESGFESPTPLHLSARTGINPDELPGMLGAMEEQGRRIAVDSSDRRFVPDVVEALFARAERWLQRHHDAHPDEPGCLTDALIGWLERKSAPGLGRPLFERFRKSGRVTVRGRYACLPQFAPAMSAKDERVYGGMLEAYRAGGYQPPSSDELAGRLGTDVQRIKRLCKVAVAWGDLAEIDGNVYLAAEHEEGLRRAVAEMIESSGGVTVAQVRERLNSSRKFVVPLMEYLDRRKFTVRKGDLRHLYESSSA